MIIDSPANHSATRSPRRKTKTTKPRTSALRTTRRAASGAAQKPADCPLAPSDPSSTTDPEVSCASLDRETVALPVFPAAATDLSTENNGGSLWRSFMSIFRNMRSPQKRLRVCESVSLGEKRFLAIVRVDSESFLLGGSTGSVSMLAKLNDPGTFSAVLQQQSVGASSLQ